jgi:YD repeat-containing protein
VLFKYKKGGGKTWEERLYRPFTFDYDVNGTLEKMVYASGRWVYYCLDGGLALNPTKPHKIMTGTGDAALINSCADAEADPDARTVADDIHYQPFGPLWGLRSGNNVRHNIQRDKRYAVIQVGDYSMDPYDIFSTKYEDLYGNIKIISGTDYWRPGGYPFSRLTYDNLHQLTGSTTMAGGAEIRTDYTYDNEGNRLTRTEDGVTDNYNYDPGTNRLANVSKGAGGDIAFAYDALGRMIGYEEVIPGATLKASAVYGPQGFLFEKADWSENGGVVSVGDTLVYYFTPGAEMVVKENVSTVTTKIFSYDLSGKMIETVSMADVENPDFISSPLVDHIWLDDYRVASITSAGAAAPDDEIYYYAKPPRLRRDLRRGKPAPHVRRLRRPNRLMETQLPLPRTVRRYRHGNRRHRSLPLRPEPLPGIHAQIREVWQGRSY